MDNVTNCASRVILLPAYEEEQKRYTITPSLPPPSPYNRAR